MDVSNILAELQGKSLDLHHVELLKHAYALQEENLRQLKTSNAELRESISALRSQVAELRSTVADQRALNESLAKEAKKGKSDVGLQRLEVLILQLLADHDGLWLHTSQIQTTMQQPLTVIEYHLSRLKQISFIMRVYGNDSEYENSIDNLGRKYLIEKGLIGGKQ